MSCACWVNAKPFLITQYAEQFYSVGLFFVLFCFFKNRIFSFFFFFFTAKTAAVYAKTDRVGRLEFSISSTPSNFPKFSQYHCETSTKSQWENKS